MQTEALNPCAIQPNKRQKVWITKKLTSMALKPLKQHNLTKHVTTKIQIIIKGLFHYNP